MASRLHISFNDFLDLTRGQIQRLFLSAQKLDHQEKVFQQVLATMSHPNRDIKGFKPEKYNDPIESSKLYREAEEFYDLTQFTDIEEARQIMHNRHNTE